MKKERKTVQSPKVFKSCLPDLSEIPMDEVSKIKMSLDSLDPEKLIQEALQSSSDYQAYRNIKTNTDTILQVTEYVGNLVFEQDDKKAQENYSNIANLIEDKPKRKSAGVSTTKTTKTTKTTGTKK